MDNQEAGAVGSNTTGDANEQGPPQKKRKPLLTLTMDRFVLKVQM